MRPRETERLCCMQTVWPKSNSCPTATENPNKSILHAALYGLLAAFEHADYSHRDGAAWKAVYEPNENTEITEKSRAMLSHQN